MRVRRSPTDRVAKMASGPIELRETGRRTSPLALAGAPAARSSRLSQAGIRRVWIVLHRLTATEPAAIDCRITSANDEANKVHRA